MIYERILKETVFEEPDEGILMDFLIQRYDEDVLIEGIKSEKIFEGEHFYYGLYPKRIASYLLIYKEIYDFIAKETNFDNTYLDKHSEVINIEDAFDYIYVNIYFSKGIYAELSIDAELILIPELQHKINNIIDDFNVKLKQFIESGN